MDLYAIKEILGERPFEPKSNYKSYLETRNKQKEEEEEKKAQEESNPSEKKTEEDDKGKTDAMRIYQHD